VITLEDWALIRRLAAEGLPKARIAERLGISRTTVVKAVGSDAPPRYARVRAHRRGGQLMAPQTPEPAKQIHYLASALKAPRITEAARRLADQARDAGWSFEDYLAAVLEREVSARNASGAELRIRAAGFPARKTLEDFDWDAQPAARQQVASLASAGFLTEARNVVLLGPPGTGKTHLAISLGITAARHGHRVLFATATGWVTRFTDTHRAGRLPHELARLRRYG
jgi:DNA replication protein DnaC